ncbi:MAG: energy transducer TonB, partial [Burkholderiales bacterium]
MSSTPDLKAPSIPHAWADLQADVQGTDWLRPEAHRLAFADPEFLLRRETRGIRFQLEMLKPDLAQVEAGIEHTVVVFGSARFVDRAGAQAKLVVAEQSGHAPDILKAQAALRNWSPSPALVCPPTKSCTSAPAVAPASWKRPTEVHK